MGLHTWVSTIAGMVDIMLLIICRLHHCPDLLRYQVGKAGRAIGNVVCVHSRNASLNGLGRGRGIIVAGNIHGIVSGIDLIIPRCREAVGDKTTWPRF